MVVFGGTGVDGTCCLGVGEEFGKGACGYALAPVGFSYAVANFWFAVFFVAEDAADDVPVVDDGADDDSCVGEDAVPVGGEGFAVGGVFGGEGDHEVCFRVQLVFKEYREVGFQDVAEEEVVGHVGVLLLFMVVVGRV